MPVIDPLFEDVPADMRDAMAKPIGDWEARPLLPTGHYFGKCIDIMTGLSKNKGTRFYGFVCQPREFGPDITEDAKKIVLESSFELSDYELPRRENLGGMLPAGQIWLTPGAFPMNREFFTDMGFPESMPQDECIIGMRDRPVLMAIGRDSYEKNGQKREFNVLVSLTRDPRPVQETVSQE